MGKLSTHVLDTATGQPVAGMAYALYRLQEGTPPQLITSGQTNAEGRPDAPLMDGKLAVGRYELVFSAGAYFRAKGWTLPDPAFLDQIPICFGIYDPGQNYHVPLLVSPYGYSTYRGN